MKQLFQSTTLRLTGWYLLVLAIISLLFSVIVYQIAAGEVERRLVRYQDKSWSLLSPTFSTIPFESVRSTELAESKAAIISILIYVNVVVLAAGGGLSYIFARRTLRPIERAHEAQVRFVSDASHELRTPLATMRTELEVAIHDTSSTKQELRETLMSSLEEVQRLAELSDTLLALSINEGEKLKKRPFDLTHTLSSLVKRYKKSGLHLALNLPKERLMVVGNQPSVNELLVILIDNGFKYGSPGTPVSVRASYQLGKLHVSIANQGKAINARDIPRLFDRFYRADDARTSRNSYGLGLAIAKQIADFHSTSITVTSSKKETIFSFTLQAMQNPRKSR